MSDNDIYKKGKFILTEWEDVNYCEHSFEYNGEELTDYEVIDLLYQQENEINQLREANKQLIDLVLEFGVGKCKDNVIKIIDLLIDNHADSLHFPRRMGHFYHETAIRILNELKNNVIKGGLE